MGFAAVSSGDTTAENWIKYLMPQKTKPLNILAVKISCERKIRGEKLQYTHDKIKLCRSME